MTDKYRKCSHCGLPIPEDGPCSYCETYGSRRRDEVRENTMRQILAGPPTKDELAAAAATCERLRTHLDSKPLYNKNGYKDDLLAKDIDALKAATWVLRAFLSVLIILIGCTNSVDELAEQASPDAGDELAEQAPPDAGDELAEQAPPDAGDELVNVNVDCYDLGLAIGGPRKVTIAYEDCDDKGYFDADHIARLAKTLIDVWIEQDLPEIERLLEHLRKFMFIAVHYDDIGATSAEFARLKSPDLYATDPQAAIEQIGDGDAFCFPHGNKRYDVSDEYSFFCVVGSTILSEGWADVVLHEIGHAALWAVYGDADPDHLRDNFWLGHAESTVMSAVLERY